MPWRIGVDEAGRGPVLGSMFVAAVAKREGTELPAGITDSKQLEDAERERLATELAASEVTIALREVDVKAIDDPEADLNKLTIKTQAEAIREVLPSQDKDVLVLADACDVDADRFGSRLARHLPQDLTVEAQHGADAADALVGAASVIAKSHREAHVNDLAEAYGQLGSGYPSDPETRTFLADYVDEHGELPSCARHSWKTCRELLATAEQGTLADF